MKSSTTISKPPGMFALIVGLVAAFGIAPAFSAPRLLPNQDAIALEQASKGIRARVAALASPSAQNLDLVERDLKRILVSLSRYHHATNQRDPEIRPTVLRMRRMLHELRQAPDPVLVYIGDAFTLSATIHRRLAAANQMLGRPVAAARHTAKAQAAQTGEPKAPPKSTGGSHQSPESPTN